MTLSSDILFICFIVCLEIEAPAVLHSKNGVVSLTEMLPQKREPLQFARGCQNVHMAFLTKTFVEMISPRGKHVRSSVHKMVGILSPPDMMRYDRIQPLDN